MSGRKLRKKLFQTCPSAQSKSVFIDEAPGLMQEKSKRYLKIALLCLLVFTASISGVEAQEKPQSIEKRKKELAEIKKRQEKEKEQAIEEMRKQHMAIQDKKTRKRMKKNRKKAARNTTNKRKFSLKRIFGKK